MTSPASEVLAALAGKTLATAESCTGGMIGEMLTAVAGSSAVYKGGVISYWSDIKESLLGVEHENLRQFGAVSATVAEDMAKAQGRRWKVMSRCLLPALPAPAAMTLGIPWERCLSAMRMQKGLLSKSIIFPETGKRYAIRPRWRLWN